jgi:large subunit ribosomal protein L20
MRTLWIMRLNAGCRMYGLTYRLFIHYLDKSNIQLNRNVLAELAVHEPLSFKAVVELSKFTGSQLTSETRYVYPESQEQLKH